MDSIISGVRVHANEDSSRSAISEISFKFKKKLCVISIGLNNQPPKNFRINYGEANFQVMMEKPLKEYGLKMLDFTSVSNLYQIKLVDHLLVKALKNGMIEINNLSAEKIKENKSEDLRPEVDKIQDLVCKANIEASKLMKDIKERFKKMREIIEDTQIEVYDRTSLLAKAEEELIDNLNRKYILVVNQLILLSKGETLTEFHLTEQVNALIMNL